MASPCTALLYATAIGWIDADAESDRRDQRDAWIAIHRAHALANGVFVAAANRVGREGAVEFYGSSIAFDPAGRTLGRAPDDAEHTLVFDCPFEQIEAQRREWPFLRDRRPDAYGDLTRRFRS